MNLRRYFFTLLVVLPLSGPLSAQEVDEDSQFYLGFAGSAVFPHDPAGQPGSLGGQGNNFKAGAGLTAAFGYAFKEGFSTEIEWGYQKVRTDNPIAPPQDIDWERLIGFGGPSFGRRSITSITVGHNGEIKTQSLMGNVYYRYPEWRVSPYAGFGFGAFLHDGTITSTVTTSTVTIENPLPPGLPGRIFPVVPLDVPSIELPPTIDSSTESFRTPYEDSRFAYQIMAGLSAEVSKLVEFRFGYRFRSSRGEPIDADQIEAGVRFRF